jgi:hypothetical protein
MIITEPVTFVTDMMLAAESFLFGHLLFRNYAKKYDKNYYQIWGLAFLCLGFGSLFGGLYHGFSLYTVSYYFIKNFWPITVIAIGLASYYMLLTILSEFFYEQRKFLYPLAFLKFGLFIWLIAENDLQFQYVVLDYAPVMLFLLFINAYYFFKTKGQSYLQMVIGVTISLLGSLIQVFHLGYSKNINHNDVYHIIEMFSLLVMYRALAARKFVRAP